MIGGDYGIEGQALRAASCLKKVMYRSFKDAEAELKGLEERIVGFSGMSIYGCRFGRHLHMGHETDRPSTRSLMLDLPRLFA